MVFISSFVLALLLSVIFAFNSPWVKGWAGEFLVSVVSIIRLPKHTYTKLNDITLPTTKGSTQIDHVFVSKYGVFVVEIKNMKGWIFGDEHSHKWTQTVRGYKYPLYNPLKQNQGHVNAIAEVTGLPKSVLFSVVGFVGEAIFKTPMPANVKKGGAFITYIQSHQEPLLTDEQVQKAIIAINTARLPDTKVTRKKHAAHVKSIKGPLSASRVNRAKNLKPETTPTASPVVVEPDSHAALEKADLVVGGDCPKCGSPLVERETARGENAGRKFIGCSTFPKCRVSTHKQATKNEG